MLGRMLEFTEEQRSIQSAIRAWCTQELEPKVAALEAGTESVYPVMRAMGAAFGIAEVARAALSRLEATRPRREGGGLAAQAWWRGGAAHGDPDDGAVARVPGLRDGVRRVARALRGSGDGARDAEQQRALGAAGADAREDRRVGAHRAGGGERRLRLDEDDARRDGGGFRITGSKTFITNAPFADVMLVYARIRAEEGAGGDGRVGAFLVERTDEGRASVRR